MLLASMNGVLEPAPNPTSTDPATPAEIAPWRVDLLVPPEDGADGQLPVTVVGRAGPVAATSAWVRLNCNKIEAGSAAGYATLRLGYYAEGSPVWIHESFSTDIPRADAPALTVRILHAIPANAVLICVLFKALAGHHLNGVLASIDAEYNTGA